MNLRTLFFLVLILVSTLPVGILGFWQYRMTADNEIYVDGDQNQIIANNLTKDANSFSNATVQIVLLSIIIAIGLSWGLAGFILKPLGEIDKLVKSIGERDFSSRVRTSGKFEPRELRSLEQSLNQMADQVGKYVTELINARELAENANRSKSEFLSSMSHELRAPLNSILGFSQSLSSNANKPLTIEEGTYVSNITDSANHLLKLVSQILDLAQIEGGGGRS